jgi:hypothetical protein
MKEYRFIKYKRLNKWLLSDVPTLRSGTPQSQALGGYNRRNAQWLPTPRKIKSMLTHRSSQHCAYGMRTPEVTVIESACFR